MTIRLTFLFTTALLLSLVPPLCRAENKVFTHTVDQPFSGAQSPNSAYMAALTKAKFEVLERAGTYLESLSVVENAILTRDEVTALAGGVMKTEVVKRENYADNKTFGIILTTRIEVDTDILRKRMDKLLSDRTLLKKYDEIQQREQELLAKIKELEEKNRQLSASGSPAPQFHSEFARVSTALTASQWTEKAVLLWSNGRFQDPGQAIEYLNHALELDGDNPRTYNSRAVAYMNLDQLDSAERDLHTALQYNPEYADARNNLGSLYYRQGQYPAAIKEYTKALELEPDLIEPLLNRGMAARKLFRFEDAFEDFHRAMVLSPVLLRREEAGSLVKLNDIDRMCDKAQVACSMQLCRSLDWLQQRGFCQSKSQ